MPTFEHTVTIISLLVGFAGVPLGWWLSEMTRSRAASQATTEHETRQMREGVVGLIEAARDMSEGARAYGYANYLKATGQPVGGQLKEIAAELNTARTLLDRRYINTRILGPEWIQGGAKSVFATAVELMSELDEFEPQVMNDSLQKGRDLVDRLEFETNGLVDLAKKHYASETKVPAPPSNRTRVRSIGVGVLGREFGLRPKTDSQ